VPSARDDRIIGHRRIRAADIKPHPLNWRTHPEGQRAAVMALVEEVGVARSVLAYDDPEWGLTMIDGHGRREWMPDEQLTVEVLDVTREEAQKLLLSMDPLAALAGQDEAALAQLRAATEADSPILSNLWQSLSQSERETPASDDHDDSPAADQYLVLVTCKSEKDQERILAECQKRGWTCKPLTS
jgi:hypothetical protein